LATSCHVVFPLLSGQRFKHLHGLGIGFIETADGDVHRRSFARGTLIAWRDSESGYEIAIFRTDEQPPALTDVNMLDS
jgi:hypothetical protein